MKAMPTDVEHAGGITVGVWHIKVGSSIEEDVCFHNFPKHTDLILFLFLIFFFTPPTRLSFNAVQCN